MEKSLKFIDLYVGIGSFHQALSKLGHECVWASEYNINLRKLYEKNFPETPIGGDIFKVDLDSIPEHDIICGGFPCQPFSRAGKMLGFVIVGNDKSNLDDIKALKYRGMSKKFAKQLIEEIENNY